MTRVSASDWRTTSSKCSPKLRGELYGAHTQPHGHHTPPENQRPPLHTMRAAGLFLYAQHSKTEPPHQARQAGPDMDHTQRPRHTRGAAPAAGSGKPRQITTRAPSRRTNTAEKRKFDKEAQLTALQKAKDTATALITDEAKRVIAEAYGDFDKWLASTIETLVREDKRTAPAATEEKQTQIATTAATAAASVAATVAQTAVAQATAEVKAAKATETATE